MPEQAALKVIGLSPRASADGIDAALVEIEGSGPHAHVALKAYHRYPYPSKMREAILSALDPDEVRVDSLSALNFALGELLAASAINLVRDAGVPISEIDLIGARGQAIWHSPDQAEVGGMWTISALQIGEPAVIAERTGVTVVADFPAADMAAGGRGAPLVPYADFVLFKSPNRNRAVQGIGAVGSVTYLPAGGSLDEVIAFDTGPGTALIDTVVSRLTEGKLAYDADGKLASAGKVDRVVLGRLLKHPFLEKRPPRSCEREELGVELAERLLSESSEAKIEDTVATVTTFTALSIARSYERWLPKTPGDVVLGGGGAKNPALVKMLVEALPKPTKLYMHEDFGIEADAKEALAFALLAGEAVHLQPANVPSATGAKHPVILGALTPGRNFRELASKVGPSSTDLDRGL